MTTPQGMLELADELLSLSDVEQSFGRTYNRDVMRKAEAALRQGGQPLAWRYELAHARSWPDDTLEPPFEIYLNGVEIADKNGHVCSAESPEIAQAIVARLSASSPTGNGGREEIAEAIADVIQREGVTHSSLRRAADAILALREWDAGEHEGCGKDTQRAVENFSHGNERFHPNNCLPDCMMPDGGQCCKGYRELYEDWKRRALTPAVAPDGARENNRHSDADDFLTQAAKTVGHLALAPAVVGIEGRAMTVQAFAELLTDLADLNVDEPTRTALMAAREYIGEDDNPKSNRVLHLIAAALEEPRHPHQPVEDKNGQ